MKRLNQRMIEMVNKLPLFTDWSMAQLASLFKHFVKQESSFNQMIYSPGEVNENIYIVSKGEVEVKDSLTSS